MLYLDQKQNHHQSLIKDVVGGGGGITQSESTPPFKLNALNSTSPLENWNLTARSNVTAATVILLDPSVKATGFQKTISIGSSFINLTLAPPAGR